MKLKVIAPVPRTLAWKAWWRVAWRFSLMQLAVGVVIMVPAVLVEASPRTRHALSAIVQVLSVPLSMLALKIVLDKRFDDFSIRLLVEPPTQADFSPHDQLAEPQ